MQKGLYQCVYWQEKLTVIRISKALTGSVSWPSSNPRDINNKMNKWYRKPIDLGLGLLAFFERLRINHASFECIMRITRSMQIAFLAMATNFWVTLFSKYVGYDSKTILSKSLDRLPQLALRRGQWMLPGIFTGFHVNKRHPVRFLESEQVVAAQKQPNLFSPIFLFRL